MSSKLNVKSNKKGGDRPRSSDKLRKGKRDGTPEKPTTPNPSHDALPEEDQEPEKKPVIINEEILGLQIKPEDLEKLRQPKPPSGDRRSPKLTSMTVRKLKPASEWDKPKPKMVTVARPAPPEAPLKPVDYTGIAGPRFDKYGQIIPYSILGDVETFKDEAIRQGHLPKEFAEGCCGERADRPLTAKHGKTREVKHPQMASVDESNALQNWQAKMAERRKQQGYLSKLLNKPPEHLVMNQSDKYRETQELRYLIDRTIPSMDYGKGYRVGSEFWKQKERIGDDLTGIHMTLSQTEQGYPPPIEHVGVPRTVLEEKVLLTKEGTNWIRPKTPFHKPWHKTPYLQDRREQLQPAMKELDPYQPDIDKLEIVGSNQPPVRVHKSLVEEEVEAQIQALEEAGKENEYLQHDIIDPAELDPLHEHPDVHADPVFGPSILFAGQPARWTGNGHQFADQEVGIEARVTFEAYAGRRGTSFLEIINDGTTSIYFNWKKIHKANPFEMVTAKVQRFYFNNSAGVILPGDTVKFPFVFKSPNAGVFTEQWQFETHPVVAGGAALVVTLRGVALQEDKYKKQRSELEQELAHKQAQQVVHGILDDLLESLKEPERPKSPLDAYITQEEIFSRKNPGLHYHNETIVALQNLYQDLFREEDEALPEGEEPPDRVWDLNVTTIKDLVLSMDEDDDHKQEFLGRLNSACISLSFPPFSPRQRQMYTAGYEIMCDTMDQMLERCLAIRGILGMPDIDEMEVRETEPSDSKKPPTSRSSKEGKKEDKKSSAKRKEEAKSSAKEASKGGGKITPASSKRPATRSRPHTPASGGATSPLPPGVDVVLDAKYKDKLYTQMYSLLSDAFGQMGEAFEYVVNSEGGPRQPTL